MQIYGFITGWWLTYPSEKYEFVSWDDYSQDMENWKMFQTTNQISTSYSLRMCITISVGLPRSAVGKMFTILLGEII